MRRANISHISVWAYSQGEGERVALLNSGILLGKQSGQHHPSYCSIYIHRALDIIQLYPLTELDIIQLYPPTELDIIQLYTTTGAAGQNKFYSLFLRLWFYILYPLKPGSSYMPKQIKKENT